MVENPEPRMMCAARVHSHSYDVRRYIAIRQRLEPSPRWPLGTLAVFGVDFRLSGVSCTSSYAHPPPGFHYLPVPPTFVAAAHIRLQRALPVAAA